MKKEIELKLKELEKMLEDNIFEEHYNLMKKTYEKLEGIIKERNKIILMEYCKYSDICNELSNASSFVLGFKEGIKFIIDLIKEKED